MATNNVADTALKKFILHKRIVTIFICLWIGFVIWLGIRATQINTFGSITFVLLTLPSWAALRNIRMICVAEEELLIRK